MPLRTIPCRPMIFWIPVILLYACKEAPVIYPERKDLVESVYASGKIIPENEYTMSALCTGTIVQKLVHDGDTVKKGQLLYLVDNEDAAEKAGAAQKTYDIAAGNLSERSPVLNDLKLSLENASIRVTNDSLTYTRLNNLWAENIGTKNNLDNAYSNYQTSLNQKKIAEEKYRSTLNDIRIAHGNARSQLTSARQTLKDYFIRSDREGIVFQTYKEAGEAVRANEVVALIGERRSLLVRLAVDQQDIDRLHPGQTVLVQADATGSGIYEAAVSRIYPVMNESDQTFRVDARFKDRSLPPYLHSSVEANIIIQEKHHVLVLPRTALTPTDSVWTYEKGKSQKIGVCTGISTLDYVEILSGITEKTPVRATPKPESGK